MKKQFWARTIILAGSLLLAAFVNPRAFGQGDLLPPPGPPAPTMKSLDQVEPRTIVNAANTPGDAVNTFIISAPGSYYFTGNVTGAPGKNGISIQADDVTLDLNGFALISGGPGADPNHGKFGVEVPGVPVAGFSIRNGSVRGWSAGGVRADTAVTLAEKLRLSDNVNGNGLSVGNGSLVRDCVANNNRTGFSCPDRTQISNCIATVNSFSGFYCGAFVTIIDCTASRNGGDGIEVLACSSVIRCNASRNIPLGFSPGGNGIVAGEGCTIADCTAGSNAFNGISTHQSSVANCSASSNGRTGINASQGSITNCVVTTNGDHGIYGDQSVIAFCRAAGNNQNNNGSVQIYGPGATLTGNNTNP